MEKEQIYSVTTKEICNIQKFQSAEVTKCQKEGVTKFPQVSKFRRHKTIFQFLTQY